MSRVLITYRRRLGDIVQCFPAAQLLARAGHDIDFYCFPEYHSIFRAVSYCQPVGPEALTHRDDYRHIYDLEITRAEYDAFRASRLQLRHYVYAKYAELEPARDDLPHFDYLPDVSEYQLPPAYNLAAPSGISQVPHVNGDWFQSQCLAISSRPWHVLTLNDRTRPKWGIPLRARSLDHLPSLIAGATNFVTVNSAPNIIAAGVRSSWHQVYEAGFGGQSNYDAPGQVVLHQPPGLGHYSWRFWTHYWRRKLMGLDVRQDKGDG